MLTSLFVIDRNNNRIPYFRPQKTPFLEKCFKTLLKNSKESTKKSARRLGQAMNSSKNKHFCSLEISIENADDSKEQNELRNEKKPRQHKKTMRFFKKAALSNVPFPEDLDEFFKLGCDMTSRMQGNQVVPGNTTIAITEQKFQKPLSGQSKQLDENEKWPGRTETVTSSMYPETPLRKRSRFSRTGTEYQVVRPQIVPETPRRPFSHDDRTRVFRVPETPLVDIFKTPALRQ